MAVLDLENSLEDRVRLAVGDSTDLPIFPDSVYTYLLTKHNNNENAAVKEAAYLILGQLTQETRSRLDRLEFFGQQKFDNYIRFIREVIKSPHGIYSSAGIYAAGIDVADVEANKNDSTVVQRPLPIGSEEYSYLDLNY